MSSGKPQDWKEGKKQAEQKVIFGAEQMAQWVKVPVTQSANLTPVPRSHTVEGENQHPQLFNHYIHQGIHTCAHMEINKLT